MKFPKQKIICHKGKCYQAGVLSVEEELDALVDDSDILEQMNHRLMKEMMR